jgi:hypothetical protein
VPPQLVEAGKAIRAAGRDGDLASFQESVVSNPRIPSCTVAFNSALDKLELEIVSWHSACLVAPC